MMRAGTGKGAPMFETTYAAAAEKARAQEKILFVDFASRY